MGQAPPGQNPPPQDGADAQESHAADEGLAWATAKPESSFFMSVPPHWAQVCLVALRLLWRTSVT